MEPTSTAHISKHTGRTADRQSGRATRRPVQIGYLYEVEVEAIPVWVRENLPQADRLCYVSEPAWIDEPDGTDWCQVRVAATPDQLAHVRPVRLSEAEAAVLYHALDTTVSPDARCAGMIRQDGR